MSSLKWQSFNTSHVTLYQHSGRIWIPWSSVSIHLMLLFIEGTLELELEDDAFQYISCYSLSHSGNRTEDYSGVSIHLMLLFIGKELGYGSSGMWVSIHLMLLFIISKQRNRTCEILFQYISCYSLSARRRLLMDVFCSFNTSHVTLYQITRYLKQLIKRFQYISCYSLS